MSENPTIQCFLEGISLPQYTELFIAQAVTVDILPSLTAQDLEKMGVALVGHQRAILNAAAALSSAKPPEPPPLPTPSSLFHAFRSYQRAHKDDAEIFLLPFASLKVQSNVAAHFPLPPGDEPLVLFNDSVFSKGGSGLVLTADTMVTRQEQILRESVRAIEAKPVMIGLEVWADGRKALDLTQLSKKDASLVSLFLMLWKAGNLRHECLVAWPEAVKQEPIAMAELNDGDSIDFGFCPSCGTVGVKTTGAGYYPGCLSMTIHLLLCVITLGGWFSIWCGWAIYNLLFNKGTKTCMKCGQILAKSGP